MKMESADKVHYESGPNMTPLVDIVMVILIFLMLTGSFLAGMHFLQSKLAGTGIGPDLPGRLPADTQLEIRVDSYARAGADGMTKDIWAASAGRVMVQNDREQLVAQLSKMRDDLNKAATPTEQVEVVINPGRQAKYKHLVEVYSAAVEARFTRIAFSTAH
jgi:biopolymer transport protein ExbD